MRRLAAVLFLGLALAGCFGGDDDGGDGESSSPGATTTTRPPTTTTRPPTTTPTPPTTPPVQENRPPVGVSSYTRDGETFTVGFRLAATDPDGDDLLWNFDVDGDGLTDHTGDDGDLPFHLAHTYPDEGPFNATFRVTDGTLTAVQVLEVDLALSGGPVHAVTGNTTQPSNPLMSPLLGASGCAGFAAGENGQDCVYGDIPAELAGHEYAFSSSEADSDFEFWDACDAVGGAPTQLAGGEATGTVPEGTTCVIMWVAPPATAALTLEVF